MKDKFIQTLHPENAKTNKQISFEKYKIIKDAILLILKSSELTHIQLIDKLKLNLKDKFQENISWYGMTVKLDLEARKIIERTKSKPERYRLKTTTNR